MIHKSIESRFMFFVCFSDIAGWLEVCCSAMCSRPCAVGEKQRPTLSTSLIGSYSISLATQHGGKNIQKYIRMKVRGTIK